MSYILDALQNEWKPSPVLTSGTTDSMRSPWQPWKPVTFKGHVGKSTRAQMVSLIVKQGEQSIILGHSSSVS